MKVLHVAGTGFGTIAGTLLGQALKKYAGYDITVTDATNLAIYGGGIGLGLAHAVGKIAAHGGARRDQAERRVFGDLGGERQRCGAHLALRHQ